MTLTTHSVAGALISQVFISTPYVGLPLAFVSHFALDAIPHWDYKLHSLSKDENNPKALIFAKDKRFIRDLFFIGLDFSLGLVLPVIIFYILGWSFSIWILIGMGLGMVPDFFQFVYSHFRNPILGVLQSFHVWIHTNMRLKNHLVGISSQFVIICLMVVFAYFLKLN